VHLACREGVSSSQQPVMGMGAVAAALPGNRISHELIRALPTSQLRAYGGIGSGRQAGRSHECDSGMLNAPARPAWLRTARAALGQLLPDTVGKATQPRCCWARCDRGEIEKPSVRSKVWCEEPASSRTTHWNDDRYRKIAKWHVMRSYAAPRELHACDLVSARPAGAEL